MIINKKSTTEFSGFYVIYKGSVLNENPTNYGISHLIEHLMCKSFEHLYDKLDRYGITWNAYTSDTEVVYHITGIDEYVNMFKKEILNSLLTFNITEKQFQTERNVVVQEYTNYFQQQSDSHILNSQRSEFGHYSAIGKLECIKNLKLQDVIDYFNSYMLKPSMIINVSLNHDFHDYYDYFMVHDTSKFIKKDSNLVIENMVKFEKVSICGISEINNDFPYINFINEMLAGSIQSPLYSELREKRGLCYGVMLYLNRISDSQGCLITNLLTDGKNYQIALDVYQNVLNNKEIYLTRERFDIIKDYFKISFRKSEINRYKNIDYLIKPEYWNLKNIINDITFEKIYDEIYDKYYTFDKLKWNTDNNLLSL